MLQYFEVPYLKHFEKRLSQRFGFDAKRVNRDAIAIEDKIKKGQAKLLWNRPDDRAFYSVRHKRKVIIVIWGKDFSEGITALTPMQYNNTLQWERERYKV